MNRMRTQSISIVALLALCACSTETPPAAATSEHDTIRTIVDSIFPVEEEIRRFKAARNGVSATELKNASNSRDELVARFLRAVEHRDSADFRAMTIDAGEFIDLYYPTSMYSHPPYKQSPEIVWLLHQQNSEKGLRAVLNRWGGHPPHFKSYTCKAEPRIEGANKFWDECMITWAPGTATQGTDKLFSTILERDGRFKILSYSNPL